MVGRSAAVGVQPRPLPTGTVTFLMTDVEGSTRLWEEHPDTADDLIARHDALIAEAVASSRGVLIKSKGEGDSTFSVFEDACDAVVAAVELQCALVREPWPEGSEILVRAALYTGRAEIRAGDYYGIAPNRGGRLRGIAHGGQSICSEATQELVVGSANARPLPADVSLRDLGLHRLRDLARAERVFQLVHPDIPQAFPPLRSLGVRHNLPPQRTSFVGRHRDRMAVRKHLEAERLVTLTGVGGCGKTRLAIEVASEELERFPDGVFFVDLAPVTDVASLPGAVAASVGYARLELGTGSGRPGVELIDYLSTREVLLVVDNCEHIIDACVELVDEILERCPRVSILATSREVLELPGEQVFPVPPLGAADESELFSARASLVRPGYEISSTAAGDVAEICRRLDGIPLAIELAAAQLAHLSTRQVVEGLDDRFHLLARGRRRTGRHQTLHAALDWSYELLADDERTVLRRLAAFPGSFSSDAAADVCDQPATIDVVRSLVRKSLVVVREEGSEHRFRLLETVHAYAEERLEEAAEGSEVRDRHRDHVLAWAEAIPPELTYLDPDGSIRRELDNLRTALRWSEERGRPDLVARLASTMNRIWFADIAEGRRWLSIGMGAIEDLEAEHRVRLPAVAAHVAVLAMEARDGELARRAVDESGGRPGMWSSLGHSLLCLNAGIEGFWTKEPEQRAEVERLGELAVVLAPTAMSCGLAWYWLGQARVLVDDFDGAIDALRRGSVEVIAGGDVSPISLAMLAGTLHLQGRHDEALSAATEVFERARSYDDSGLWSWALYCSLPYALELGQRGRHEEAVAFMRDLLKDSATLLTPGVTTSVIIVLAALAELRNDVDAAGLLVELAGRAMITEGMRTPVDIALYSHYSQKVHAAIDEGQAIRHRERAAEMNLADAIALGLEAP